MLQVYSPSHLQLLRKVCLHPYYSWQKILSHFHMHIGGTPIWAGRVVPHQGLSGKIFYYEAINYFKNTRRYNSFHFSIAYNRPPLCILHGQWKFMSLWSLDMAVHTRIIESQVNHLICSHFASHLMILLYCKTADLFAFFWGSLQFVLLSPIQLWVDQGWTPATLAVELLLPFDFFEIFCEWTWVGQVGHEGMYLLQPLLAHSAELRLEVVLATAISIFIEVEKIYSFSNFLLIASQHIIDFMKYD